LERVLFVRNGIGQLVGIISGIMIKKTWTPPLAAILRVFKTNLFVVE